MKIEIRILKPDDLEDFKSLILVFEKAFEMENFVLPNDIHLQNLLNNKFFFIIVAKTENKIIAGLTIYILDQYYSERPLAYLYDLGVLPEYQRKGIGKNLIQFIREYFKGINVEEIYVQADLKDEHAIEFYHSTTPTSQNKVVHFSYLLNK